MKVKRWNLSSYNFDMHSASSYVKFLLLSYIDNFLCLALCDLLLNLVLFLYFCLICICIFIYVNQIMLRLYSYTVSLRCRLVAYWVFVTHGGYLHFFQFQTKFRRFRFRSPRKGRQVEMFEVLVWRIFCIWLENILGSKILYLENFSVFRTCCKRCIFY